MRMLQKNNAFVRSPARKKVVLLVHESLNDK